MQEDNEFRFQELGGKGAARGAPPGRPAAAPQPAPQPQYQPPPAGRRPAAAPTSSIRRRIPTAPGAPRTLGSMSSAAPEPPPAINEQPIGAPGGRARRLAARPVDAGRQCRQRPGLLRPAGAVRRWRAAAAAAAQPQRDRRTAGDVAADAVVAADEYDLAYGYILRKDYALAEEAFRDFLQEVSERPAGAGRAILAGRKPVPAAAAIATPPTPS